MTTKELPTIVEDIYSLFSKEHTINEESLNLFAENLKQVLRERLETVQTFRKPELRVSKLGTKDRKMYFELNATDEELAEKPIAPDLCLRFLYGDIIEELLLLLVREAGHKVEGEQGELEVEGVVGHRDCIIDGVTVDIKSASNNAFRKFKLGKLSEDDPFGYIAQISTYAFADKSPYGAFLVMNKETGEIILYNVPKSDMIHPPTRIKNVRKMLAQPKPPTEKCYPTKLDGKSGNIVLNTNCTYCPFKEKCWEKEGLRKFRYANGIKYFVEVVKTPRVEEVID